MLRCFQKVKQLNVYQHEDLTLLLLLLADAFEVGSVVVIELTCVSDKWTNRMGSRLLSSMFQKDSISVFLASICVYLIVLVIFTQSLVNLSWTLVVECRLHNYILCMKGTSLLSLTNIEMHIQY